MIIHIVRHPESKPQDTTVEDVQRQVTKKGAKKLRVVLDQYDKAGEMDPDIVFCGPETRNLQAGDIVRDYFSMAPEQVIQNQNLAVDGDPDKLLADIQQWIKDNVDPADVDSLEVLVVGSNPTLENFFQLVHGLGTKAGQSGSVKLKKGSVAKLKVYGITGESPTSQLRSYLPPGLAGA